MGDYSDTLNLLDTKFPMRGNLAKREPAMVEHIQKSNLYDRIRQVAKGRKSFVLHDGPPYANGDIHLGHVVNKNLKDFVVRTKNILGYDASYIPGWDCHGLPIERELEKRKVSKEDPLEFRKKCRAYAEEQINLQRKGFERLGIIGDWNNHYRTMHPPTEAKTVLALGKLQETGLIYRALRPVLHCLVCASSLAEAEVEYENVTSKAIDVAFAFTDLDLVAKAFGVEVKDPCAAVIWTTTTWTIPANRAIAYGPELDYSLVSTAKGNFVVATELVKACLERWEVGGKEIAKVKGSKLEGLCCTHPFYDRLSPLYEAQYVTVEEGTGLVHNAPAHGVEDNQLGSKHGLDERSLVDAKGSYHDSVEKFGGQNIFKAIPAIITELEENKKLVAVHDHKHEYPICWRHKVKVIFRTSQQWFMSMDDKGTGEQTLRELSMAAIDKTEYFPSWGKERMGAMVSQRPDWCLSRQRMWNSPVAFFVHKETGDLHPDTMQLVERIAKIIEEGGIENWFALDPKELIGDDVKDYEKVGDTLDVWFDSGVTHSSVMNWQGGLDNRPDMYLEGSDQHRGWFMSSLMTACAMHGEPPWRQILTHGFVVGGDGKKMGKSAGNALAPEKLLNVYGADILRLWVANSDYSQEIKISNDIVKTNVDIYRLLRNRIRFLLANLSDFDYEKNAVKIDELAKIDRYMLVQAEECRAKVFELYDKYAFLPAMQTIHGFCNQELGRFYMDILKDRIYTLPVNSKSRRSAQTALFHITKMLLVSLGPTLSFTADEAWQVFTNDPNESTMLHILEPLPEVSDKDSLGTLFECVRSLRTKVAKAIDVARFDKKIDCPDVELHLNISVKEKDFEVLSTLSLEDLAYVMIVSKVTLTKGNEQIQITQSQDEKCERCWRRAVQSTQTSGICVRCEKTLDGEADDERQV